jgi:hypothetical protein
MRRIILIATVCASAMLADARLVRAAEMPWCAFIAVAEDAVYEDCRYRTFEECYPNVLAGNRGFCNRNPRWTGETAKPRPRGKRRARKH